MVAQRERTLAGIALAASALIWLGVFLLLFYVPRLAAVWSEMGTTLSPPQRWLVLLSEITQKHGYQILPGFVLGTAAAIWWRIDVARKARALT